MTVIRLHFVNTLQQCVQQLIVGQFFHLLALFKDHAPAVSTGDADVGLPGFAGAVDHAAHDGHRDGLLTILQGLVHLASTLRVFPDSFSITWEAVFSVR